MKYLLSSILLLSATFLNAADANVQPFPTTGSMSMLELLKEGGWVMIPLLLCSVIAVALIILNIFALRRARVITDSYIDNAETYLANGDLAGLHKLSKKQGGSVPRVIEKALWFANNHPEAEFASVKEIAMTEGTAQASKMNLMALYLLDVGALAPMLGLFGTVVGILRSFGSIAAETSPMKTMALAQGVSQALVATAAGLIVGITAMAFYSFFRGRVQALMSELEGHSTSLLEQIGLRLKNRGGQV
ncbi:MAG: MotA/TolQ/ExbB proton channel family protein [Verrucomicrobiota bacterium]|nr:MotA/TolQ/ExbB proton channel family protein [Verrucomicrobiota bacterium]